MYHAGVQNQMPTLTTSSRNTKRFCLILVKPSHYDDEGYVIQWFRSTIPSNSLAAVYGLARDCALRKTLGEDVAIEIHPFDETNTRIRPEKLARMIEEAGAGMVMLIGVQSNQFPHALDLAKPLRDRGIQVGIGGFHVSGILSKSGAKTSLKMWNVAFSTQPDVAYTYWKSELGNDDGSPVLELAYAITVHKSQGSEFGTTFVIIPSPCRLLSRELLYTALTRQQNRVVLFMQGDLAELRSYASPRYSEAAARVCCA